MKNNNMEINKHNYEAFFLLYTDNELNGEERKAVEDFVEMYPELKEELNGILQTRLQLEENAFSFDKTALYRSETTSEPVNASNCESYFLLYADDELTAEQKTFVEDFVAKHPDKKATLDLLLRVKVQPDEATIFKNKSLLYRREAPVVNAAFQWRRMVAAASIILIGALVWMNFDKVQEQFDNHSQRTQIASAPTIQKKETSPVSNGQNTVSHNNEADEPEEKTSAKTSPAEAIKKETRTGSVPEERQANKLPVNEQTTPVAANKKSENLQPAPVQLAANNPVNNMPMAISEAVGDEEKMPNKLRPAVKPVILDEAAFNDEDEDDGRSNSNELALLDTDNTEKKSKGTFRGLFRKASRFVNRATNADGDVAVVRIASFEIAKK